MDERKWLLPLAEGALRVPTTGASGRRANPLSGESRRETSCARCRADTWASPPVPQRVSWALHLRNGLESERSGIPQMTASPGACRQLTLGATLDTS